MERQGTAQEGSVLVRYKANFGLGLDTAAKTYLELHNDRARTNDFSKMALLAPKDIPQVFSPKVEHLANGNIWCMIKDIGPGKQTAIILDGIGAVSSDAAAPPIADIGMRLVAKQAILQDLADAGVTHIEDRMENAKGYSFNFGQDSSRENRNVIMVESMLDILGTVGNGMQTIEAFKAEIGRGLGVLAKRFESQWKDMPG